MNGILDRLTNPDLLFLIPAILIGITVHEFSHAIVSYRLGDPTPKFQKRLTLNPLDHIDPFGLISLILVGFGWGRPVQIDPRYYKNPSRDKLLVSFAGPLSNIVVLVLFSFVLKFTLDFAIYNTWYFKIMRYIINVNAVLCVFNLLPLPPLDGSKILLEILPLRDKYAMYYNLQRYSMPIFIVLVMTNALDGILQPLINAVLKLSTFIITL